MSRQEIFLSFLKGTDYAMYVGPMLSPSEQESLRKLDISIPVIYLPEVLEGLESFWTGVWWNGSVSCRSSF